jgi:uncharacterized protein involved in exopolysaccharide biosynthesis
MTDRPAKVQDEIELIDILRVIWKWKYLILAGTLICGLIAGAISWSQPKIYRVDMVLQAAVVRMDSRGKKTYIETPKNIKTLIEAGAFNRKVSDNLKNSDSTVPKLLKWKVHQPRQSDSLIISYEHSNVDLAITILEQLAKQLFKTYNEAVEKYKNNYESQLLIKRNQLSEIKIENKISVKTIDKMRNRINVLLLETEKIDEEIKLLIDKQSKYILDGNKQRNINAAILYNNLIQQLSTIKTTNKNEIAAYFMRIDAENGGLKIRQNKTDQLLAKIREIENEMISIQNMQVIKSPTSSRRPVRPKTKLNVMFAAVVGLFLMFLLGFFLEYLSKYKNMQ